MSEPKTYPKRKPKVKTEVEVNQPPRRWQEKEIEDLHNCIMKFGHKNVEEIKKVVPSRNEEMIKTFMRTAYDTAIRRLPKQENTDPWIQLTEKASGHEAAWKDSQLIAKVIKYLSVDGLLENHPLPERCQGVNFKHAYRMVYQALMGYPIQPVNKATADLVSDTLKEVFRESRTQKAQIQNLAEFLKHTNNFEDPSLNKKSKSSAKVEENVGVTIGQNIQNPPKVVKVYQRKRPSSYLTTEPSVKIFVQPNENNTSKDNSTQNFSVTIENEKQEKKKTVLNVPVPVTTKVEAVQKLENIEKNLIKSLSYNPFQIPEKWLEEPFHLSLLKSYKD